MPSTLPPAPRADDNDCYRAPALCWPSSVVLVYRNPSLGGGWCRRADTEPVDDVQTLRMPQSGLWVQWSSSTRSWRMGGPGEPPNPNAPRIDDEEWLRWTGHPALNGRGQWSALPDDPNPPATWWVLYGEHRYEPVSVTLPDGTLVPVRVLGGAWAAEWTSTPQRVTVRRGATESSVPLDRPMNYPRA